jgi:hypothetical protein
MAVRKTLSKETRFEVFKRDGFKCTYCGAEAPRSVLHVDHIKPVAKGGTNDLLNLVTACVDCNAGKSDRELSDDTAVMKQRTQLDELHQRREQMEMMLSWREGMKSIKDSELEAVRVHFSSALPGWHINSEGGLKTARGHLRKYGLIAVLDAIDLAVERYAKTNAEGQPLGDSVEMAWSKVGGILHIGSKTPEQQRLHYVKGILKNRLSYVPYTAMREMEDGLEAGIEIEEMVAQAKETTSWSKFSHWLGN